MSSLIDSAKFSTAVPPKKLTVCNSIVAAARNWFFFFFTQENARALQATRGNVHGAVEQLLGNMRQ